MHKTQSQKIPLQDIPKAYSIAALVVKKYGDVYLPLFQRMHDELMARQEKSDMKAQAIMIADIQNQ